MSNQEVVNLGNVSMFIGAALNHPAPPANGTGKMISTIKVSQYKVKFSEIRVYCSIAHPSLVKEYWTLLKGEGEPTDDFFLRCKKSDAHHYRNVYLSMLRLLPAHIRPSVVNSADYRELLYETPEDLRGFITDISERADLQFYLKRWDVENVQSLKEFLFNVCRFSMV